MTDLRNDERGFTLVEVLVATLLMVMVLMALYALFDMSLRVYGIGNSEVETNERARIALERMEREIRNAKCGTSGCTLSGDESEISLTTQTGAATVETVTYKIKNEELIRVKNEGVIEKEVPLAYVGTPPPKKLPSGELQEVKPLSFHYCDDEFACDPPPDAADIAMVEITLIVTDRNQSQTLNTVAGLRNYKEAPTP